MGQYRVVLVGTYRVILGQKRAILVASVIYRTLNNLMV